ncbi:hypothetical protein CRUP_008107, partial [Coryphaenoides rupestris]
MSSSSSSKAPEKRRAEEEEEDLLSVEAEDACVQEAGSDSEESIFSGLEDSGSDSEEDDEDEAGENPQDIRNTVGNIPLEWYKDFPHIGYDLDGKKIFKPIRNKDELDDFLDKMENPDYWRTVQDKQTGSDIVLTDDQVDLVRRLQRGQFGDVNFNQYQPTVEFFSGEVMIHPVTNRPEDKRSFIPSLIE